MLNDLRSRSEGCISDLEFDEWHAGEVEPLRLVEIERHVATCDRCGERKALLAREADAFLEKAPVFRKPSVQKSVRRRMAARWSAGAGVALALAAAAGIALLVREPNDGGGTRVKGSSHIGFYVKRGSDVKRGADGERVRPGDQLRFTVTTIRESSVAILSLDAKGTASVYYPVAASPRTIAQGRDVALDGSVELDETLGEERLYGLFCEERIDVEAARVALARSRAKPTVPGCTIDTLTIVKESAP